MCISAITKKIYNKSEIMGCGDGLLVTGYWGMGWGHTLWGNVI